MSRKILGIDLGGAAMATTGYVLLEGSEPPHVRQADWLRKTKTPARPKGGCST